ncbi:hypothetical protein [Geoalkalibacter halelectricus]|uniref:Uncharacterized protein n=1 Tax=Geoalkalibacter halelectricus TaxID=2847045 RepID=A0ABY5ZFK6_9BACT|nr:hypothetical protein [Geoalkalibacter halelectricus]MDO3378111.1 hypothetical protein [Geoalkalibacter halelectricus]UWZ77957.1 hypothetical protein L9S41_09600 [Geoalkalibacter halelectricus]
MQTFRSLTDIENAHLPPNLHRAVTQAVRTLLDIYGEDYDPEDGSFVVLIDPSTTDAHGHELLGRPWSQALLEGVIYDSATRCFLSCCLFNNEDGVTLIIPDEEWLDADFRAKLVAELNEAGGAP